nr:unnamed protein product [Callosobruchus analis]
MSRMEIFLRNFREWAVTGTVRNVPVTPSTPIINVMPFAEDPEKQNVEPADARKGSHAEKTRNELLVNPRFKHLFFTADSHNSVKQYILHFLSDVTVPNEKGNISCCSGFDSDCADIPLSHLLPTPENKSKITSQKPVWDSFSDMVSLVKNT